MLRIGWYVHHHGAGHRTRARVVGSELARRGHAVTLLGSGLADGLDLARDDRGSAEDVTARGRLHWVPLRDAGLRTRGAQICSWLESERADVLVVDVSVEATALARLLGVPTVVVAQPGRRDDRAHALGRDFATAVLAPWPVGAAAGLAPELVGHPGLSEVGGLSAYAPPPQSAPARSGLLLSPQADSAEPTSPSSAPSPLASATTDRPLPSSPHPPRTGLLLAGGEGFDDPDLADRVLSATPGIDWCVADGRAWIDDIGVHLAAASVVVAHAGQNTIADVARVDRPLVVLPQQRPFGEQDAMAGYLDDHGFARAVGRDAQADPRTDWRSLIEQAMARPTRWADWQTPGAVERAADVIEAVARG